MALDERVKVLEDEVGILKDQIRNTLLEIQEQILIHYYPDLRAKNGPPPDLNWPAGGRGNGAKAAPSFQGLQRVRIVEEEPAEAADVPQTAPEEAPSPAQSEPVPPPAPQAEDAPAKSDPHWAMVTRLMDWASEGVQMIGKERTAKPSRSARRAASLTLRSRTCSCGSSR